MSDNPHDKRIAAFVSSSDRSRTVLVLMILASILAFMAFWNSADFSWLDARLRIAKVAAAMDDGAPAENLRRSNPILCQRAEAYLKARHWTAKDAEQHYDLLMKLKVDHVLAVRVPLLGIIFDINDLSLFAGITFVVLLLWFRFALMRELSNLRSCLDGARGQRSMEEMRAIYELLAMRQVLTVPPLPGEPREWFWNEIPKVMYALPLVVQSAILIYDIASFTKGSSVSDVNTIRGYVLGSVCWVIAAMLTVDSYRLVGATERRWEEAGEELVRV